MLMTSLRTKEVHICSLLDKENPVAKKAFKLLYDKYFAESLKAKGGKLQILRSIYLDRQNLKVSQLACNCKIQERTLIRYRHEFVEWFYVIFNMLSDFN